MRSRAPIAVGSVALTAAIIVASVVLADVRTRDTALAQPSASSTRPSSHFVQSPSAESTSPTPQPTWEPAPSVAPAANDVLALAGDDGVPGLLDCGTGFTFSFDVLAAPTGAEHGVGPEYDALRAFVGGDVATGETRFRLDSPTREVTRSPSVVAFLIDRNDPGPWGENGGPYLYLYFRKVAGVWEWAGSGDCQPRAYGPPGYAAATWSLDPSFRRPRPADRVLHILVSEFECSSGRSASGRIGPAYVITDRYEVHIEILVQWLPGGQDCQAAPPTPATLRLAEPLGDRTLRDTNAHIRSGSGG
jgi:hypothetical protein